jgi:acetoin utilization deacetylase AcuC-like enzyme
MYDIFRGHPEKPERISAIFSRHEEYGLLKRCHMLKVKDFAAGPVYFMRLKD